MRMLALLLVFFATPALAQPLTVQEVLQNAVDDVIRPAFNDLRSKGTALEAAAAKLCTGPSAEALAAAREQFGAVALAHARIENFHFGPLTSEDRAERLLFWPDPKGIALRQVQTILRDKDETATNELTLRTKSVGVQGLTALEFVLFGTGADELLAPVGDFRCRYGHAVAAALRTVTAELSDAWATDDGIADHFIHPGPDNVDFRTETESLEGLARTMAHGIEAIRDTRLMPFLGMDGDKPAPKSAIYWRSALTIPVIAANSEGLLAVLTGSKMLQLASSDQDWVESGAKYEFANVERTTARITKPVAEALADPAQKEQLDWLVILTGTLETLLGENVPTALGLSVGFSELDKD